MSDDKKKQTKVQGEGDYEAARAYRKKQHEFAQSGKVEENARDAAEAVDGAEAEELERARKETADKGPAS